MVTKKFEHDAISACKCTWSDKKIENWEQGINRVKGAVAGLLFLLYKKPEILQEIYYVSTITQENYEGLNYKRILNFYSFNLYVRDITIRDASEQI